MASFFTNPKQFINLLTTAQDCKNIFPGDQAKYNWDFVGLSDSDWNFSLEWITVIVDSVRFNSDNEPNFTNSLVTGYFEGGTLSFGTTQDIRVPANMYTGPILPASETNIPITIVNMQWLKNNGETVNRQILFIQNYEPGVRIGDPTLDDNYIAIEVAGVSLNTATVILELIDSITVYEEAFRAKLICDVPNALAQTAYAKFYARSSTGTSYVLVHTSTWTTVTENLNVSEVSIETYYGAGDSRNLPPDTYTIRGEWPGRRTWPLRVSNTLSLRVVDGVPLNVTLNPAPVTATVTGTTITLTATANTATGYPVFTATNIANTVTFSIQGTSTYAALTGTRIITTTTFVGDNITATATASLFISNDLVDIIPDANTTYTLITATIANNVFTGTALITRTYPLIVNWNFLRSSLIASGSTSTTLTVSTTRSFTVNLTPLTVEVNELFGVGDSEYYSGYSNPNYTAQSITQNITNFSSAQFFYNPAERITQIRAYVNTSTTLIDTTVTFKAVYTASTAIISTIPKISTATFTVDLVSAQAPNKFTFELLPDYLKIADTFTLAGITWPVTDFNMATNQVTTNNWQGVINPNSYFQTGVQFNIEDPTQASASRWLGYNYDTTGTWLVFGNNQQTKSGTGTYQTWIPGDRWQISVPWYSISTGFISTSTYTWADNPLYYYRFEGLPLNLILPTNTYYAEQGGGPGANAPYFIWANISATNQNIRHYIRAVNYATNTVIAWPGGHADNGGSIAKLPPDPKTQPLNTITNVWIDPLLENENIGKFAKFYNGNGELITGTSTLVLGKALTPAGGSRWQVNSRFPNQTYQTLDVDIGESYITSLLPGTYQITAEPDFTNLVTVLNNRIGYSTATTLVVYSPQNPVFSSTLEESGSNYIFKAKIFKPIQADVNFLKDATVNIYEGASLKGTAQFVYSLDSAETTAVIAKSQFSTVTNAVGSFSGSVDLMRWNPTWPKFLPAAFNFYLPTAINRKAYLNILNTELTYNANNTLQVLVSGTFTGPFIEPQGWVQFQGTVNGINGTPLFQTATIVNGIAQTIMNTANLSSGQVWNPATITVSYVSTNNFAATSTTTTLLIDPPNATSWRDRFNSVPATKYSGIWNIGFFNLSHKNYYPGQFSASGFIDVKFKPGSLDTNKLDKIRCILYQGPVSTPPPFLLQGWKEFEKRLYVTSNSQSVSTATIIGANIIRFNWNISFQTEPLQWSAKNTISNTWLYGKMPLSYDLEYTTSDNIFNDFTNVIFSGMKVTNITVSSPPPSAQAETAVFSYLYPYNL